MQNVVRIGLVVLAVSIGTANASEVPESYQAKERLRAEVPLVQFAERGEHVGRVYGGPLSFGTSPEASAEQFRNNHAGVFSAQVEDLLPQSNLRDQQHTIPIMWDPEIGEFKFTLVYYSQFRDGLPVFRSDLRLLVRNEIDFPLVLAASSLRDLGDFGVDANQRTALEDPNDLQASFLDAQASAIWHVPSLTNFSTPKKIIWAGVNDQKVEPRVALSFIADNFLPNLAGDEKSLFIADFETGDILHIEPMMLHADGNVSGLSTEGVGADFCEADSAPLPYLRVTSGGNEAFTDVDGDYSIADDGTVEATLDGIWFDVFDFQSSVESLSVPTAVPTNILFNALNLSELIRAQTNNYVHANIVRDFIASHNPSYPTFTDTNIPAWANRTDGFCPGNAWYDPADGGSPTGYSINFCSAGPSNPNTSWSSVVYHEFGHHMVNAAGSGQGQYGEGAGDVLSVIILDDPNVGLGFFNSCATTLRSAVNTMQYPCSGVHACAPLYSGAVWDVRNALILTEPASYLQILGNLAVNSTLLHSGTEITPQMTIDWLTLDDDDANIDNGTPHRTEICAGFDVHNLTCPVLAIGLSVSPTSSFDAAGEVGGPFTPGSTIYTVENLGPGSIDYDVTTTANWLTITNGSGTLANVSDTAQVTVTINANANSLPIGQQSASINFTNTTDGVGDTIRTANLAVGIPDLCTSAAVVCSGTPVSDSTVGQSSDGTSSCGTSNNSPDLWYEYTPNSDGIATFSLCTGTNYDAVLSVHSGCPGSAANDLGCDDDGCGSTGGPSTVTINVTEGTAYLVRVTGWEGLAGTFTLTITGPDCQPEALSIAFPNGLPDQMLPGVATSFDVQIQDGDETYQPGTGTLHYRYDGGAFLTAALSPQGGDLFEATLPAAACTDTPEFYISAQGNLGSTVTSPSDAPSGFYSAFVGMATILVDDDFETDLGWTVSGGASDGQWDRGVPISTAVCNRGNPPSDADGSGQCWLTDNSSANACNSDVDGGTTILTSPLYDISSAATIEYSYWLDDGTGVFDNDSLEVEVATDAGSTNWTLIRSYTSPLPVWQTDSIDVGTEVTPSSTIRLRFLASDLGTASLIEAAIDGLLISSTTCEDTPTCSDGILNQGEDRIDCGGPCTACDCTTDGACDDTDFCNGAETCDAFGVCQPGSAPCGGSTWCDEVGDTCVPYGDGDVEPDGDHDLGDFARLQTCFGEIGIGACQPANMTGTGTVELDDYALFEAALDGPS